MTQPVSQNVVQTAVAGVPSDDIVVGRWTNWHPNMKNYVLPPRFGTLATTAQLRDVLSRTGDGDPGAADKLFGIIMEAEDTIGELKLHAKDLWIAGGSKDPIHNPAYIQFIQEFARDVEYVEETDKDRARIGPYRWKPSIFTGDFYGPDKPFLNAFIESLAEYLAKGHGEKGNITPGQFIRYPGRNRANVVVIPSPRCPPELADVLTQCDKTDFEEKRDVFRDQLYEACATELTKHEIDLLVTETLPRLFDYAHLEKVSSDICLDTQVFAHPAARRALHKVAYISPHAGQTANILAAASAVAIQMFNAGYPPQSIAAYAANAVYIAMPFRSASEIAAYVTAACIMVSFGLIPPLPTGFLFETMQCDGAATVVTDACDLLAAQVQFTATKELLSREAMNAQTHPWDAMQPNFKELHRDPVAGILWFTSQRGFRSAWRHVRRFLEDNAIEGREVKRTEDGTPFILDQDGKPVVDNLSSLTDEQIDEFVDEASKVIASTTSAVWPQSKAEITLFTDFRVLFTLSLGRLVQDDPTDPRSIAYMRYPLNRDFDDKLDVKDWVVAQEGTPPIPSASTALALIEHSNRLPILQCLQTAFKLAPDDVKLPAIKDGLFEDEKSNVLYVPVPFLWHYFRDAQERYDTEVMQKMFEKGGDCVVFARAFVSPLKTVSELMRSRNNDIDAYGEDGYKVFGTVCNDLE